MTAVLNMTQQAAWCQDIVLQQTVTALLHWFEAALSGSSLLRCMVIEGHASCSLKALYHSTDSRHIYVYIVRDFTVVQVHRVALINYPLA